MKRILSVIILMLYVLLYPDTIWIKSDGKACLQQGAILVASKDILIDGNLYGASDSEIVVNGDWTNNGTFTSGGATVCFTGEETSVLQGLSSSDFDRLHIDKNSAGVELDTQVSVANNLSLISGVLKIYSLWDIGRKGYPSAQDRKSDPVDTGSLTMGDNSEIVVTDGELDFVPVFAGMVNVIYNGTAPVVTGNELPAAPNVLNNLTINTTGTVTMSADATVNGSVNCVGSNLITGSHTLFIAAGAATSEQEGAFIEGEVVAGAVNVGTSSYEKLGFSVSAGTDDIGDLLLTRYTGGDNAQMLGDFAGISCYWDVSVTSNPSNGRELTLSWFAGLDNGIDLTLARMWKQEGGADWLPVGYATNAASVRSVTESINSFSRWTIGGHQMTNPIVLNPLGGLSLQEDETFTGFDLNDVFWEPNGQDMYFDFSGNSHIAVTLNLDNSITLTPEENWWGSETITFHAGNTAPESERIGKNHRDFSRGETTDQLQVTVNPVNDPPVIVDFLPAGSPVNITVGNPQEFSVIAIDVDDDVLFYQWYLDEAIIPDAVTNSHVYNPGISAVGERLIKCVVDDNQDDSGHGFPERMSNPSEVSVYQQWIVNVTYALQPPQNILITRSGSDLILSWDSVSGEVSYKIYSSSDPAADFPSGWTVEAASVSGLTWTDTAVVPIKKFYRITSVLND